jgi:regulator of protease activity HflC (stomatin/prohibitin superfamily)
VSVDAEVAYRIRDVIDYALVNEKPRETLDAIAYRLLMQKTVVTDLDTLLLVDRDRFSTAFTRDLQLAADAKRLGLEILHTTFVSLHPPVRIAPDYQAVVGAEIERETLVIRAEVERAADIPRAQADATEAARAADAAAAIKVADAEGGAGRYRSALESFRAAEALYRLRRWLEALEAGLTRAGLRLYVVDHTLEEKPSESASGQFWLDLRTTGEDRNP